MKTIFDKEKLDRIFSVLLSEKQPQYSIEIRRIAEEFAQRGTLRSGMYTQALIDKYSEQLKEKADYKLRAYFQLFRDAFIDATSTESIISDIKNYITSEKESKIASIKTVLASMGENSGALSASVILSINNNFSHIESVFVEKLKLDIENHNNSFLEKKKKEGYWNSKAGLITAISSAILALFALLTFLYSINVFSFSPNSLEKLEINKFSVFPEVIHQGEKAKLFWSIHNADSVNISGIGKRLSLNDSILISPQSTQEYHINIHKNKLVINLATKIMVTK